MEAPPQPVYVIRGHASPVHALHFYRSNSRLISADAEGWLVLWNVPIRRPVAVWKAHQGPILAATTWDDQNIITHGRDHKIYVWQVRPEDEAGFDSQLPASLSASSSSPPSQLPRRPWMLHSLDVNALNFCAFSMCLESSPTNSSSSLLLAVPSSRDTNTVDIYQIPSEERKHVAIGRSLDFKTGMPMALKLFYLNSTLTLLAGYESGHAVVFTLNPSANTWSTTYSSKPHSQPVLSLDYDISSQGSGDFSFYTSSADSMLAKHQVSHDTTPNSSPQSVNTHHAGQQGLVLRSDGKILATAGWDSRIRIYSTKSMEEVAVLKWHKEGCYTVTFAHIFDRANGLAIGNEITPQNDTIITVAQSREQNTKTAHILAAGSKDGRISLWEVF